MGCWGEGKTIMGHEWLSSQTCGPHIYCRPIINFAMNTLHVVDKHYRSFWFVVTFETSKVLSASMYIHNVLVNNLPCLNSFSHIKHLKFRQTSPCIHCIWVSNTKDDLDYFSHWKHTKFTVSLCKNLMWLSHSWEFFNSSTH